MIYNCGSKKSPYKITSALPVLSTKLVPEVLFFYELSKPHNQRFFDFNFLWEPQPEGIHKIKYPSNTGICTLLIYHLLKCGSQWHALIDAFLPLTTFPETISYMLNRVAKRFNNDFEAWEQIMLLWPVLDRQLAFNPILVKFTEHYWAAKPGNKKSNHVRTLLYARPFDVQTCEILKLFLKRSV